MKTIIKTCFVIAAGMAAASGAFAQDKIVPQQTISLKPNAFGCMSKDKFDAANHHAQAGEQAQMQSFFSGYDCLATPTNASFRVVRVVGHDVEFVNAANHDDTGLWTADRFIKE